MKARRPLQVAVESSATALVGYVGLGLSVIPMAIGAANSLGSGQYAVAVCYLFVIFFVAVALYRLLARKVGVAPPQTTLFQPFNIDKDAVWPRPVETELLGKTLIRDSGLHVLIGDSGSGKSTLLRFLVKDWIKKNSNESVELEDPVTSYELPNSAIELLATQRSEKTVLIFDQFEQWIAGNQNDEHLKGALRHAFENLDHHTAVVLAVRSEWFFELRFLGTILPPLYECTVLGPVDPSKDTRTMGSIRDRFGALVKDQRTSGEFVDRLLVNGSLLPLEAQLVGAFLEQQAESFVELSVDYFDHKMGGVAGAIDGYFKEIIEGSPNERVCLKILCALSAKIRYRKQESLDRILPRLFEDNDIVISCVAYLTENNLLVRLGTGQYELTHDYLAGYFNFKSGSELDPVDRDNISLILETARDGTTPSAVRLRPAGVADRKPTLGITVILGLVSLMFIRLLYLGLPWNQFGTLDPQPLFNNVLDATYIPIFIPHVCWIVYVGLFYDRFLGVLRESLFAKWFSRMTVLYLVPGIILGTIAPFAWMMSISIGGLIVGLKFLSISRRPDLNKAAQERLRTYGLVTTGNLFFVLILSIAATYISFRYVRDAHDQQVWLWLTIIGSVMMTQAALAMAPGHVSRKSSSTMLALVARPRGAH